MWQARSRIVSGARRWSLGERFYDHRRGKRESLDRREQIFSSQSIANRGLTFY
jgi:hypothetical protein